MQVCSKCGKQNADDAVYCAYCATSMTAMPTVQTPTIQIRTNITPIAVVGIICAFISLLFLPPLFGILAVILGAYALSKASEEQKSLGWITIILGVVFMVIGIFLGMFVALML